MATIIRGKAKVTLKINTKVWDKMVKNLSRKTANSVDVGWWGTRSVEGIPMAQIAAWNEEGHMNGGMFEGTITPPRPFIRIGFLAKLKKTNWEKKYFNDIHQIAIGKYTWKKLHEVIGKEMQSKLMKSILDFNNPPNSAATISLKGFNDPLIHSGRMYDSVKYRVKRRTSR